jgi:uncharacterized protein YjbI with pentapeptide repeats
MRVLILLLALLMAPAGTTLAQGMMQHVDLSSPKMSEAELSRAEVEAILAAATADRPADLTDKSLNGLDLSGLDLSGADLRWARLNRADLRNARLAGARLDLAWRSRRISPAPT